ncbi:MAG: TetR/AcrR family transcriptional regulator [Clostridium sp.]|nr:TetR/AcrR family transcriptional regulator [Clostridium sp.]
MDIRIEKTEKAIRNAFIELRSKKALEKITVKELCQLAYINKSTFYSHYEDIYALSDALELETVASIINSIPQGFDYYFENLDTLTRELCLAFVAHISLINILFSGKEKSCLANRLETAIKELIFKKYPEYQNDTEKNILLSYCIQGAYYAYSNNQSADADTVIQVIETITRTLKPLYSS